MTSYAKQCKSTVIPALRYRDAAAAIEWLMKAFGFEKKAAYANTDGTIAHAELTFGNGMIMLGSSSNQTPYGKVIKHPRDIGDAETQTPYLIVSDPDAVYAAAKAAGAEMVIDIKDESYGGRGFTCRDLEGHIWSVGSYDPWGS